MGIVRRRRLRPPAASTVYELTDLGRELEPTMLVLMRWGSHWMSRPAEGLRLRHTGLPSVESRELHAGGWRDHLERLATLGAEAEAAAERTSG